MQSLYLISSDSILQKQDRSEELMALARTQYPHARLKLYTHLDFQSSGGEANLRELETDLKDLGLFSGFSFDQQDPEQAGLFDDKLIIKIYLRDLDKTAVQVLHLLGGPRRTGVFIIVDLPRFAKSYITKGKLWTPALPKGSVETQAKSVLACLRTEGSEVEFLYPPEGPALLDWIRNRASRWQLSLTDQALHYLATASEGNLLAVDQSLRLLTVIKPQAEIGLSDLTEVLHSDSRYSGYELPEAIFNADSRRALNIVKSMLNNGSAELEVIGVLLSRLDQALSVLFKAKNERIYTRNAFSPEVTEFFKRERIMSLNLRKALLKAAQYLPEEFISYICTEQELSQRCYLCFDSRGAFLHLQNICMCVGDKRIMQFAAL